MVRTPPTSRKPEIADPCRLYRLSGATVMSSPLRLSLISGAGKWAHCDESVNVVFFGKSGNISNSSLAKEHRHQIVLAARCIKTYFKS
jgi:hypothetical protein